MFMLKKEFQTSKRLLNYRVLNRDILTYLLIPKWKDCKYIANAG